MTERDLRSALLNTLLTTPHRDLAKVHTFHQEMIAQDPLFYGHLAAWYADHGQVRDHKEMFVVMLCLSSFEGHRDVGLALLRRLPPYEVARVVDFIKGYQVTRRRRVAPPRTAPRPTGPPSEPPSLLGRLTRRIQPRAGPAPTPTPTGSDQPAAQPQARTETVVEKVGLFRNVPRSLRTEIERYLREREADDARFDKTATAAHKSLKRLYAGLRIQPSPRAQAMLFDDQPPEGSTAFVIKQIARATTPADQARVIVEHRIPYRVASTVIKEMSPTVIAALIEVMTPQEVINNIASLKRRGAMDNPDLKQLIDAKLAAAKSDKRVSAFKAKVAAGAAGATGELAEALEQVTDAQVKTQGSITRPTALLIDKSGSMQPAIEVGKQLGALVSAICQADLYAYAFDSVAFPVAPQGKALADWEKALAGINAGGGTSCGVALAWMRRKNQRVEQIVIVTDEEENTAPNFKDEYLAYAEALKVRPAVIVIKLGQTNSPRIEAVCAEIGVAPNVFEFRGDYYALPNVIPFLTYPSLTEMVMEILSYPLPKRKAA